jgi:hypothetical protein
MEREVCVKVFVVSFKMSLDVIRLDVEAVAQNEERWVSPNTDEIKLMLSFILECVGF